MAAATSAAAKASASHSGGAGTRQWGSRAACHSTTARVAASRSSGQLRHPVPSGEDGHEPDRHHQAHQRHHQHVRREAGKPDAVKVHHHGQRQPDLHHGRDHRQLRIRRTRRAQLPPPANTATRSGSRVHRRRVSASSRISTRKAATRGGRWRSRPVSRKPASPRASGAVVRFQQRHREQQP